MDNIGITRRIDDLGRIVIPKEIRRNLKIKDNQEMEINIFNNKIILSKFDYLKKDRVISLLISSLRKKIHKNVLYTSREKVIDKSLIDKKEKEIILDDDIINIIESRKKTAFLRNDLNLSFFLTPIIVNGDLFGSLIVYSAYDILDSDILLVEYLKSFLENYLE